MKKQKAQQKVFILVVFDYFRAEEEVRVHSVYFSREKAEERAKHLLAQNKMVVGTGRYTVAIIKKPVLGFLKGTK